MTVCGAKGTFVVDNDEDGDDVAKVEDNGVSVAFRGMDRTVGPSDDIARVTATTFDTRGDTSLPDPTGS